MPALRNPRWEKAAVEIASGTSPLEAMKRAGYAKASAANARRMRNDPRVRERIAELQSDWAAVNGASVGYLQAKLMLQIEANYADFYYPDPNRSDGRLILRDLRNITRGQMYAIEEISFDSKGRQRIRLADRRGAIETYLKTIPGGMQAPDPPPAAPPPAATGEEPAPSRSDFEDARAVALLLELGRREQVKRATPAEPGDDAVDITPEPVTRTGGEAAPGAAHETRPAPARAPGGALPGEDREDFDD